MAGRILEVHIVDNMARDRVRDCVQRPQEAFAHSLLIEEAGEKSDPMNMEERRCYYLLTEIGQRAFTTELQRDSHNNDWFTEVSARAIGCITTS